MANTRQQRSLKREAAKARIRSTGNLPVAIAAGVSRGIAVPPNAMKLDTSGFAKGMQIAAGASADSAYIDPRALIPFPQTIIGYRRVPGPRDFTEACARLQADGTWMIVWSNGQVIYVPAASQVLSRLTSAGCDTITIERSRRRS